MMRVLAPVLRSGFVRKHLVERHVVSVDVVACRPPDDRRTRTQVADERRHGDVDHVVTKPPPVRPASRNHAAAEARLDLADQHIAAEDVMSRELITAGADEDVSWALDRMRSFKVRRMPVINSLEVLVGIITYDDLVRWMAYSLANFTELFPEQQASEKRKRA